MPGLGATRYSCSPRTAQNRALPYAAPRHQTADLSVPTATLGPPQRAAARSVASRIRPAGRRPATFMTTQAAPDLLGRGPPAWTSVGAGYVVGAAVTRWVRVPARRWMRNPRTPSREARP